jgi:hypothetical protein
MMSAQKAAQGSDGMALYRQGGNLMSVYAPVRLVSRPAIFLTASLSLLGAIPAAWAGPAEEIADINRQRAPH